MKLPEEFQDIISGIFYDTHIVVVGDDIKKDNLGATYKVPGATIWEGDANVIPSDRTLMEEVFGNWISGSYYLSAPLEANLKEGYTVKADTVKEKLRISALVKRLSHYEAQCVVDNIQEYSRG